jgi:hypothetical protein
MSGARRLSALYACVVLATFASCSRDREAGGANPVGPSDSSTPGAASLTSLRSSGRIAALRPFPSRRPAFEFRSVTLEQFYTSRGDPRFNTRVDPEGSVVWVAEYLRYRVSQCSAEDAFSRILTQINGGGVPPPCSNSEQPFPDRQDALTFRRRLEEVYQGRGASLADTHVNDEGDVVWTMEYLRYALSGCSHEETVGKIMDQIGGRGVPPACTTNPPPMPPTPPASQLRAAFTVTPNDLTVAKPGQCIVQIGGIGNILRCTFDAGSSTPQADIKDYEWNFFNGRASFTGRVLRDVQVDCSSFGSASLPVTLKVRARTGTATHSTTKQVTFILTTYC